MHERVTHNGRRESIHDYNTLPRPPTRRRVHRVVVKQVSSGSRASPTCCAGIRHAMRATSTLCTAPSGVLSMTYEAAQTDVRTLPKTARVSFSSNVPQTGQSDWPQPVCQSKRPYYQTLHPETLSWRNFPALPIVFLEPHGLLSAHIHP